MVYPLLLILPHLCKRGLSGFAPLVRTEGAFLSPVFKAADGGFSQPFLSRLQGLGELTRLLLQQFVGSNQQQGGRNLIDGPEANQDARATRQDKATGEADIFVGSVNRDLSGFAGGEGDKAAIAEGQVGDEVFSGEDSIGKF